MENTEKNDGHLEEYLRQYNPDFLPFFETRVMAKIAQFSESYNKVFDNAFRRAVLSGVAAVVVLLVTIFVSDGALSADVLIGTSNLDLENITAMVLEGNI
jgi:hypothetical protein